jgi:hypothetical protein
MPVPFIVEPDVFESNGGNQAGWVASHERLFQMWGKFGVLVLPPKGEIIAAMIAKLPQPLRDKWQTALKSMQFRKKICSDLDTQGVFETVENLVALRNDVNVACLEETRAICFGIDHDMLSRVIEDENFEICRLESVDQTRFFREEVELWDRMVYSGTKRADVWDKRFRPLAKYAKSIAIIDRYCLLRHEQLFFQGGAGLSFFLRKLNQTGHDKQFSINMFASDALDYGLDLSRATANLAKTVASIAFPTGTSVNLHVMPDRVFGKVAHDRFIRFDAVVTSIGNGLQIFEADVCESNFDCGLRWDVQSEFRDEIEAKLRSSSIRTRLL